LIRAESFSISISIVVGYAKHTATRQLLPCPRADERASGDGIAGDGGGSLWNNSSGAGAQGQMIGNNDLWIAAHAKAAGLTLVTNNEREFRRVRGLRVENWAA
jgi:PIN domain-containing protein